MTINKKGDIMRKFFVFILVTILCFSMISCSNNSNLDNEDNIISSSESGNTNSHSTQESLNNNSSLTQEDNGEGGGEILPRKYRNNYYQIPAFFAEIVNQDIFSAWEKEYYANNYSDDTNVMVMVDFIKEFNISKEDFERANLKYAYFIDEVYSHICLDPQDYADQEFQEIYNTEIIYTFDNDLINEYYLGIDYPFLNEYQYIEAVEAGTYETRTTEFIDIEQMEAEIIAKYGEAEIVTETTTAIPEETEITE